MCYPPASLFFPNTKHRVNYFPLYPSFFPIKLTFIDLLSMNNFVMFCHVMPFGERGGEAQDVAPLPITKEGYELEEVKKATLPLLHHQNHHPHHLQVRKPQEQNHPLVQSSGLATP